ncbi:MAG: imelysin family protein [Steroidobacterales bacterium]
MSFNAPAAPAQVDQLAVTPDVSAQLATYGEIAFRNYTDAYQAAVALQKSVDEFVADPADDSEEQLSQVRQAWLDARLSYGQTEAFRFYEGPIDFGKRPDGAQGPEGRINAWPLNEQYIDATIEDSSVPITRATLIERNARDDEADVTTGYHAIEYLLWGRDTNPNGPGNRPSRDFIGGGLAERRRAYLKITTDLLVDDLASVAAAWALDKADYRAQLAQMDAKESVAKILTGIATLSGFELGFERLATALDSGSQEDEQSCFSDSTIADVIENVTGVANVYFGRYGDSHGAGIDAVLGKVNPTLNQLLTDQINRSLALAKALDRPFDQTLLSPPGSPQRAKVEALVTSLQTQTRLLKQAGVALGVHLVVAVEKDE